MSSARKRLAEHSRATGSRRIAVIGAEPFAEHPVSANLAIAFPSVSLLSPCSVTNRMLCGGSGPEASSLPPRAEEQQIL